MKSPDAILSAKALSIGYGDKIISGDIELSLRTGELVCILGQNGVGKSTLLRTLSNLQPPVGGSVELEGKPLGAHDIGFLGKKIGIVTTEKVGVPNMSVRELVGLGRFPYSDWLGRLSAHDHEVVEAAISQCRINYLADKKLMTLSDGQRQKAMIARVLAQETDIILLDEPTAHLDLVNRAEVMQLLSSIKAEQQKCILVSTHELPLSLQFADKLWLMNYNQPMIQGAPEDLAISGQLGDVFFHDRFDLDVLTGKVVFKDNPESQFELKGEDRVVRWVTAALERKGYGVATSSDKVIEVSIKGNAASWKLVTPARASEGVGVESLLDMLEELGEV